MAITAEKIEPQTWVQDAGQHVWQRPHFFLGSTDSLCFVAKRSGRTVGSWILPVVKEGAEFFAVPDVRLFPYAAPLLQEHHPLRRRETLKALMAIVVKEVSAIGLPLEPDFHDIGAFNEFGGICEARHTHIFERGFFDIDSLSAKTQNHYRKALSETVLTVFSDCYRFNFHRAIVDNSPERVRRRRSLADRLAADGRIRVVEAVKGGRITGQLLIMLSGPWAIYMHTWFDRINAPRGTPSLLTLWGTQYCFRELQVQRVDLEGSILARIDSFMDGLGAKPSVYPILYWARERPKMLELLLQSAMVEGRAIDASSRE